MPDEVPLSPWFQALVVTPPVICGVQLRPFSIGHELILSEKWSPYVCGGIPTAEDTLWLIQACSRTLAECREWLAAGGANTKRLRRWAKRWARNMDTASASVRVYLDNYGNLPTLIQQSGESRKLDASPYWHMARILCQNYGATLENVWDTPKPVAICAVDAWAEAQGNASVASASEEPIIALVREGHALLEAGDVEGAQAKFKEAELMATGIRGS